ncbi:MAG: glycosyltransferase, partial [Acidobacteriota bacterium]
MTYADLLATWAEVRASSDRSFPRGHRSGPTPRLDDLPPPPADRSGWPWTEGCKPLPPVTPDGAPWPHIAIVTPNYNYARFLEETIRSVLLQGYPNLSYAVVDDGSRDESMAIVARYAPWLAYHVTR